MERFLREKYRHPGEVEFTNTVDTFDDIYDFSIGDPDLTTNHKIIDYALEKAKEGQTHYSVSSGTDELKQAIVRYHKNKYNQTFKESNIMVTSSATHAMYLILNAIINPGDEILLIAPFFASYLGQIELNGGKPVVALTKYENGFQLVKEDIEKVITPKTKAVIINNPCNPSGVLYNEESFEILYQIAEEHDLLVIADDIYTIFTYGGKKFKSISEYKDMSKRTLLIKSLSKDFCMTGWRLGYVIADECVVKSFININESVVYSPNIISQNAAVCALDNYKEFQDEIMAIYPERIHTAYEMIKKSKYFSCIEPQGTFYIFMNVEKTGMTGKEFAHYVYENAHVKVFDGSLFGGETYKYFVRLAVNLVPERIKEAFEKLEALTYKN